MSTSVDIHETRAFGYERYAARQVPFAVGLIVFSVIVIALTRHNGSREAEALVLGLLMIAASLGYIGYAFYRRSNPKKPIVELSADGILYRVIHNKEFHIPWHEVQGIGLIDITLRKQVAKLRNVTAVTVSQSFFDANLPMKSWWERGPGWGHYFVAGDDVVQIAFHHDLMSVPADELWNEIETRWRVLSGHPQAPVLPAPRLPKPRTWFGGWAPSPVVKRTGLATLCVLAVPAIYFWHWPIAWLTFPDLTNASSTYLRDILDSDGVHARPEGNGMVVLRRYEVSEVRHPVCDYEIARDGSRTGSLTPFYVVTAFCTADLRNISGVPAKAIFKLASQTLFAENWDGSKYKYEAIQAIPLDVAEADARLCRLGWCAAADPAISIR